jgi:signal transduction histidine kinase/ActR/RegA family two-component response regulator
MEGSLFGSDLWEPALDKYAEATGLSVELFGIDGRMVLASTHLTPLAALFREYGFEPGLFAECARRCLDQTHDRPAIASAESHGLTIVGTSLVLEGEIVGAAVAGYALAGFSQVPSVQRWAQSTGMPFDRLWSIVRQQAPVPERRLMLHGELLQVLGDALLRENYRTRQYEETVVKLQAASAAKDEFLAVLSHELRTPLAPIAGWASVLKKSESLEQVHQAAEAIERNAFLQSRMIDDLLDMSGIRQGTVGLDLEILDLMASVRAAAEVSAAEIEKKAIRMEITGPGEPLFVEGDAGRLQQVFGNIVSNAVKFTPAGGSVRIFLDRERDNALVRVADNGKGIAPEFLPFAFEIFRQQEQGTHRAHEGLGIGLSLVKKLTELHKGTVSIASAGPGQGTEVSVRLPLATGDPDAVDSAPEAAESAAPALAGLSILVVEDSADARDSLRAMLQLLGAQVAVVHDGREALDMMAQGAKPDVVLCDLLMPRLDGFEFLRELDSTSAPPHPPVIAVSGLASDKSRERTLQAGFEGHIKKPFDEAAVVAAVSGALGRRRESQSPASRST